MILIDERGVRIMSDKEILKAAKQRDKPSVLDKLVEAIGRHPSAEADADVADAINAVGDVLRQKEEHK